MKKVSLFVVASIVLFSCSKGGEVPPPPKPIEVFYRLAMRDIDSNYTYSVVENISVVEYIGESSCDRYCKRHPEDKRCKALPVTIEYFVAQVNGRNTLIEWKTTYEESIDHFIVEKSLDGIRYEAVTKAIKPKGASVYRVLFMN